MTGAHRSRLMAAIAGMAVGLSAGFMFGSIGHRAPDPIGPAARTAPAMTDHASMGHAGDATDPASRAYLAASARMHAAMSARPTGNADLDFARGMIPHHQGAIDMARIELRYGNDPRMRTLAEDVVRAQETEISRMRRWVTERERSPE